MKAFTLAPMVHRIDWAGFDAVLLDLDGVITPTAEVHEHAWAELFADFDFTPDDYLRYVDGKPRYDGVRSFLESRGVELPEGDPSDPPGTDTICAMGNRKNVVFNEIIERDGITPYPGTIALLDLLDRHGVRQAVVSSSKNARPVLDAAGLGARFEHVVDGVTAADEGLAGKPAPDMFLRGAELLEADPDRSVVVEDAVSGVAAGVAGGFALVLGVDRGGNAHALESNGAHLVVTDLDETLDSDHDNDAHDNDVHDDDASRGTA
jgi:beta-phosphoglucomutase family hydrolase